MISSRIRLLSVALFCAFMTGAVQAQPDQLRPLSLEDMLMVEGLGAAVFDPGGRWLVFERIPPYASLGDYSFGLYAFSRSGHQLWKLDLSSGTGPARLKGLPQEGFSFLDSLSPDGSYLSVYLYREGKLSIGVYDLETDVFREATHTPALGRAGEYVPVWVSKNEIAFVALPEGVQPGVSSVRPYVGRQMNEAWRAAWRGDRVTALEVSSDHDGQGVSPEPGRLILMNAGSGEEKILSEGLYADLRSSPDGRYLSALLISPAPAFDEDLLHVPDRRTYKLQVHDLLTGQVTSPAPGLDVVPLTQVWHPASGKIAVFARPEGEDLEAGRFYLVGAEGGLPDFFNLSGLELVSERERGWRQRPERAVFLGDDLVVQARELTGDAAERGGFGYQDIRPAGLSRKDWYAIGPARAPRNLTATVPGEAGTIVYSGDGRLAIRTTDGVWTITPDTALERITPDSPGVWNAPGGGTLAARRGVARPGFGRDVILTRTEGGRTEVFVIDFTVPGKPSAMPLSGPMASGVTVLAASSRALRALAEVPEGGGSSLVLTRGGPRPSETQIVHLNGHLDSVQPSRWVPVVHPADRNAPALQELVSCVLLPPDFDPASPPPLIIDIYPGTRPGCQEGPGQISAIDPHSPYLWAGHGFALARISTPTELIRAQAGPISGMPELIEAGVDAIVAQGYADPDRMALTGFSQGGVSALFVAAHTDRFKAIIVKNSWTDLFFHYFEGAGIFSLMQDDALGSQFVRYESRKGSDFSMALTPFMAPDLYRQNSPLFLAPQIGRPVLLIHSDMDSFGMGQFDAMYAALLRLGTPVTYIRYLGEGHGPSSPANIRHMWARKLSLLEQYGIYRPAEGEEEEPDIPDQVRSQLSIPQ